MNIGVLEDNPAILDYMTIALEMAGHHVQTFTSSTPLIDRLLTNSEIYGPLPYDVIVVDLLLPGSMSGFEAIKHIQRSIPLSRLPVIIITAKAQSIDRVLGLHIAKVDDYITKPFSPSELLTSVRKVIANAQSA